MLAQIGGLGLGLGLGGVGSAAGQAISQGYGLGTQYGILLPYSRTQELEADKIGLILMAKAGYDPALALDFWRRMMAKEDHKLHPPQFMSTHPRDHTRIQAMADFLPEAETYYVPPAPAAGPPLPLTPPPEASPPRRLPANPACPHRPRPRRRAGPGSRAAPQPAPDPDARPG